MSVLPTPQQAIRLLERLGCDARVIRHCKAVSKLAVEIARQRRRSIDLELVRIGALLHDIGRSQTHDVAHAYVGSGILRDAGYPEPIIKIVERHIGAGIPANEAVALGLPEKEFVPRTLEEKIVAYADKLIEGNRRMSYEEARSQLADDLGPTHPAVGRFQNLHRELMGIEEPE